MTMLTSIMVLLTVVLVLITVPVIYGSWLQFMESAEERDLDKLIALQAQRNEYIIRHLSMALLAIGFVAAMNYLPGLEAYSQTSSAIAIYSVISFIFAFAESILAQKISGYATSMLEPVKVRTE
jgi:hypothetical protein